MHETIKEWFDGIEEYLVANSSASFFTMKE